MQSSSAVLSKSTSPHGLQGAQLYIRYKWCNTYGIYFYSVSLAFIALQNSVLFLSDRFPSVSCPHFTQQAPVFSLHRCPPGHMTKESSSGKVCVYTLCASRPCRHGTCVAHSPSRYSCHCSEGYRGRHCEVTLAMFHNEDSNTLSLSSMFAISICVMAFLGSYVDYVLFYLWWPNAVSLLHLHVALCDFVCYCLCFHL